MEGVIVCTILFHLRSALPKPKELLLLISIYGRLEEPTSYFEKRRRRVSFHCPLQTHHSHQDNHIIFTALTSYPPTTIDGSLRFFNISLNPLCQTPFSLPSSSQVPLIFPTLSFTSYLHLSSKLQRSQFIYGCRYAVLGAGFAGLSVAWHLLKVYSFCLVILSLLSLPINGFLLNSLIVVALPFSRRVLRI